VQAAIIVFSIAYNLGACGFAMAGLVNPLVAAVIMPAVSLASIAIGEHRDEGGFGLLVLLSRKRAESARAPQGGLLGKKLGSLEDQEARLGADSSGCGEAGHPVPGRHHAVAGHEKGATDWLSHALPQLREPPFGGQGDREWCITAGLGRRSLPRSATVAA